MDSSNITVLPVEPPDFMALARIEAAAFAKDEIGLQMFGPSSEASIRYRASTMGDSKGPGEAVKFSKAVITNAAGEEEIVGFASWRIYSPANVPEDTKDEDNKMIVPPVPCPELYIDVIVKGDLLMNKSCGEEGYFKLQILASSPHAQRRGVGTKLLKEGLREADVAGLQSVLLATRFSEPLYTKHGFLEYEIIPVILSDYKGGEGKGSHQMIVMNRPAVTPAGELA